MRETWGAGRESRRKPGTFPKRVGPGALKAKWWRRWDTPNTTDQGNRAEGARRPVGFSFPLPVLLHISHSDSSPFSRQALLNLR